MRVETIASKVIADEIAALDKEHETKVALYKRKRKLLETKMKNAMDVREPTIQEALIRPHGGIGITPTEARDWLIKYWKVNGLDSLNIRLLAGTVKAENEDHSRFAIEVDVRPQWPHDHLVIMAAALTTLDQPLYLLKYRGMDRMHVADIRKMDNGLYKVCDIERRRPTAYGRMPTKPDTMLSCLEWIKELHLCEDPYPYPYDEDEGEAES